MTYSVSSWFVDQALSENPPIKRTFTIAGSDYSDRVTTWPTISTRWNELRPNNVSLSLANEEQTFNFFKTAKTNVQASCTLNIGFTHPTSGDELINLFTGTVGEVAFNNAAVTLRLLDKVQQLSDRIVGTSTSAAVFSASTLLASDVAWTLCTCYGGYSGIASTSNPDIDYAAWQAWAYVFSLDQIYVGAAFKGQKVTEALRKIMENTQSAVFLANNKLTFKRWSAADAQALELDAEQLTDVSIKVRADALINKQWVEFDYRVSSGNWGKSVFFANTASINSYGIRETVLKDESFWYANSSSALNMAQRALIINQLPYDQVDCTAVLAPLYVQVGETINIVDEHLGLSDSWRIMAQAVNMEDGSIKMEIDGSQGSLSGITWVERVGTKNVNLNDVVWGGNQFVAVGDSDGSDATIIASPDGVTWAESENPKAFALNGVAHSGALLAAVGAADGTDSYIVTSADGITWTERAPTVAKNIALNDVVWGNSLFVAVGAADGTDSYILTSPDGITWTERAPTVAKNIALNAVTWGGSLFVAVGVADGTDAYILTSPDGVTWTERANPKNFPLTSVAYRASTVYCAVGGADGTDAYIVISTDGITWVEEPNSGNIGLNDIIWSGGLLCAVGEPDGTDAYIVTSTDGYSWTERANPRNIALNGIAWSGELFCAVGDAVSSTLAMTWLDRVTPTASGSMEAACSGAGIFCMVGDNGRILISNDGVNWTAQSSGTSSYLYGVTYAETLSLFVAVGAADAIDSIILTSPDGVTWTERANPKAVELRGIVYFSFASLLIAVGASDGTDAYILTSPDGVTWTERANPKNLNLFAIATNDALACAVGSADGTDAYIITTSDGINWTERANPKNFALYGIVNRTTSSFGFIAVGQADGIDSYIVTSNSNCTVWTEQAPTVAKNISLRAIARSPSAYIAVGDADGSDAYILSAEGIATWTEQVNSTNLALRAIAWKDAMFCAAGAETSGINYVITTVDNLDSQILTSS